MSCTATLNNSEGFKNGKRKPNLENLLKVCGNRKDPLSSFKYYVNKANSSARIKRYGIPDITTEYLKYVWDSQNGLCPYTGKIMSLPETTGTEDIRVNYPTRASLDRIDSSKGYVKGNVEFVCFAVNLAKSDFSREIMLDFFKK